MSEPTEWTDPRLLRLLEQLCGTAWAQVDRRVKARVDADDLQQEVLCALVGVGPLVDQPLPVWEAYMRRAVESGLTDLLRRHLAADKRNASRDVRESDLSPGHHNDSTPRLGAVLLAVDTSPSQRAVRNEEERRREEAISRLPPDQQLALRLHLLGHGPTAIAEVMKKTPDAVSSLIYRATKGLRDVIS